MKKVVALVLALYMVASCAFSIAHAYSTDQWEFRECRNGLLCVEYIKHSPTEGELVIYSPFTNYADVFLFGVCWGEAEGGTEFYVYSDY